MSKVIKIILIISIAIFGAGVLFTPSTSTQAQTNLVDVLFENTPLFDEANFLPGDSITRWVKVTNVSGETQRIATEAINYTKPIPEDDLSRVLIIVIKQGGTDLYGGSSPTGSKSLYDFYQDSEAYLEIYLSDLGSGETVQYDFTISFPSEKENEWQEKTTHFDVLIGSQGTTSPPPPSPPTPPGGGGGGGLPPGLTIFNEASWNVTANSVTITWTTSYFSTSQVIYAAEGEAHTLDLDAPNYGYAHSKEGDDSGLEKVTGHSVTITGLTSGTTYYYRVVSHASLAISREYSFTTLGVKEIGEIGEEIPSEGIPPYGEEILPGEVVLAPTGEGEIEKPPEERIEGEEEIVGPEEVEKPILAEERPLGEVFATEGLLAAIGAMPFNLKVILIIAGVIIAGLLILWLIRKRRFKKIKS